MPETVNFGLTTMTVKKVFSDMVKQDGSMTKAITTLLNRDKYLTTKYRFRSLANCEVWEETAEHDTMQSLSPVLQMLDTYVRFNRLESRSAALEELLYASSYSEEPDAPKNDSSEDAEFYENHNKSMYDEESDSSEVESLQISFSDAEVQTNLNCLVDATCQTTSYNEDASTQTEVGFYHDVISASKSNMQQLSDQTENSCTETNGRPTYELNNLRSVNVTDQMPASTLYLPLDTANSFHSLPTRQVASRRNRHKRLNPNHLTAGGNKKNRKLLPVTTCSLQQQLNGSITSSVPYMHFLSSSDVVVGAPPATVYSPIPYAGVHSDNFPVFRNVCNQPQLSSSLPQALFPQLCRPPFFPSNVIASPPPRSLLATTLPKTSDNHSDRFLSPKSVSEFSTSNVHNLHMTVNHVAENLSRQSSSQPLHPSSVESNIPQTKETDTPRVKIEVNDSQSECFHYTRTNEEALLDEQVHINSFFDISKIRERKQQGKTHSDDDPVVGRKRLRKPTNFYQPHESSGLGVSYSSN